MVRATSLSVLRVSWTSPECPYGVLDRYILYYRQADAPQTTPITSDGYTSVTVTSTTLQYSISGLLPITNYAIHVQAVVLDREGHDLLGVIDEEQLVQTGARKHEV